LPYGDYVTTLIEDGSPRTWRNLEMQVARILTECGYDVEVQKTVQLARGRANIDVWADDHSSPRNVIAVECKHWANRVPKHVVHSFRTVVGDSGANTGLMVAASGYQSGAIEAAAYSNVRLINWVEFQTMCLTRWIHRYMMPTMASDTDVLHEYTEPINLRIFRKADALPQDRREQFKVLRNRFQLLAAFNLMFHPLVYEHFAPRGIKPSIDLPFRNSANGQYLEGGIPDSILDATALRPLMTAVIEESRRAIVEFDQIFGERA
jgi:restriction system protein